MIDTGAIRLRWDADGSKRDERGKRVFAASEARAAGWGGVAAVAEITGLARSRIIRGLKDLDGPALEPGRIRRAGGGRHRITATDGTLLGDLTRLVEPATMGDPMRPLTWVSKSREKLACALNACGHDVSPNTVGRLLVDELEYGSPAEDWERAAAEALHIIRRPRLFELMAPSGGASELSRRSYANLSVPELAEDLSAWTRRWALARGRMNPDVAVNALQLWLSPAACDDVDVATHTLAVDPFVARAVRYASLRFSNEIAGPA